MTNEFETFNQLLQEATQTVEQELLAEDEGWTKLGGASSELPSDTRIANIKQSRLYYLKDPLAKQSIRLWTDYTFGTGVSWHADDENVQDALKTFWDSPDNKAVLSTRGQRKASDKLLVDGEVFFAIFLGPDGQATLRTIDPLEITEIITDPDDIEKVMYYRRLWATRQGQSKETIYRGTRNIEDQPCLDITGASVKQNDDALVYHLAYNTIGQRGNPLLLPALDWIKQYRRFLASRVAIMLALARFAWKIKVQGGQTAVTATKAVYQDKLPAAGSMLIENMASETQPIRIDTGAQNAYQDARMLKLQVCAAVGIPEQYFGDISTGNLATAKTVELPMLKMFESYQSVWTDAYKDINEIVLAHNDVPSDNWYVDMDFPAIAPEDVAAVAAALALVLPNFPELASSPDVLQVALMSLGINNTQEVIDALNKEAKTDVNVRLAKALKAFKETVASGNGKH